MNINESLRAQLVNDDWIVLPMLENEVGWWADEIWHVQSQREHWATEVYIHFLVNPVWDAPRAKGEGVVRVTATSTQAQNPYEARKCIAEIDLSREYPRQLLPFIYALNFYRRTQCVDV